MKHIRPEDMVVTAIWRAPFSNRAASVKAFEHGSTVADIVAGMDMLPIDFAQRGVVMAGEHELDRRYWERMKPKGCVSLTFHYPLRDGGSEGGGRKAVLGVVLAVATILTAGAASAGFFATSGGLFAAGSLSANALAAGISVAGSLLAAGLSAPPISQRSDGGGGSQQRGPASLSGNLLQPGAPIPRVVGTRRIYPPFACQPLIVRDGLDEYAEGVYILAGPHFLTDIRIGDAPVDEAEDVDVETREGWQDDDPISLVYRYGATKDIRLEMSTHQVSSTDYRTLVNQSNPGQSLPKWHALSSSRDADEVWFHFSMPGGMTYTNDVNRRQQFPIRIRMRASSSDPWINLPELHISSKSASELKPTVKLIWGSAAPVGTVPASEGFVAAYKHITGQSDPATSDWDAHSSFTAGAGNDGLYSGVEGSSNVHKVTLSEHEAVIYLTEGSIPKGEYQIEVERGLSFNSASFTKSNYQLSGTVRDFFSYVIDAGASKAAVSREYVNDRLYLLRLASVFNRHQINDGNEGSGLAIIAVRALNRQVPALSVSASGWVQDWGGSAWDDWVHGGEYLAAHYRDVLRGNLSPDPIDEEVVDDDSLLDWRTDCIANGYTCNLICEGAGIDETLTKIAGCGYARPGYSEVWGVIRDYDRSGEDPVQIFSSRNSANLSMAKAFARVPDAFRCTYKSADDLDQDREVFVFRTGTETLTNPRIEAVEYEGLVTEADVVARAEYDLAQIVARSAFWSFDAPIEAIVCRRGDLVGINHDVIDKTHASARVIDVYTDSGDVTGVELDSEVPVWNELDMHDVADMHAVTDMHLIGLKSSISLRQSDGTDSLHEVDSATGTTSTVMFVTPVPVANDPNDGDPLIRADNLAKIGRADNIFMRLVVFGITPGRDYSAKVTAVAEAPELMAA